MIKKVKVSMNIPVELKEYVEGVAEKNGYTFTTMVQVMINDYKKQEQALEMSQKFTNMSELIEQCKRNGIA